MPILDIQEPPRECDFNSNVADNEYQEEEENSSIVNHLHEKEEENSNSNTILNGNQNSDDRIEVKNKNIHCCPRRNKN